MKTIYGDIIIEGSGTVLLRIAANRLHHTFSLCDCLYIPDALHHGLLSVHFSLSHLQAQFFFKAIFVMPNLTSDSITRPLTASVSSTTLQSGLVMSTAIPQPITITAVPLSWPLSPPTCLS